MRLAILVVFSVMGVYGLHQTSREISPQLYREVRLLSFIPNLEIYAQSHIMSSVDLHKIDFLKSSLAESDAFYPVIDSVLKIPPKFQGYQWSLVT